MCRELYIEYHIELKLQAKERGTYLPGSMKTLLEIAGISLEEIMEKERRGIIKKFPAFSIVGRIAKLHSFKKRPAVPE